MFDYPYFYYILLSKNIMYNQNTIIITLQKSRKCVNFVFCKQHAIFLFVGQCEKYMFKIFDSCIITLYFRSIYTDVVQYFYR